MSTTERERFRTYFEYAYCKKMLDGEFESYDIDERIRRIAKEFFRDKTPGAAGPVPKMNELVNRTLASNKDEFWVFGNTVSRIDGIEMRRMIQMIDETIRMTKMGTMTGNKA